MRGLLKKKTGIYMYVVYVFGTVHKMITCEFQSICMPCKITQDPHSLNVLCM